MTPSKSMSKYLDFTNENDQQTKMMNERKSSHKLRAYWLLLLVFYFLINNEYNTQVA